MAKRRRECSKLHCYEPPVIDGLCQRHHDEHTTKERRYSTAVDALHKGLIDGELVRPGPLRDEFNRVRDWWFEVCQAVTASREHPILKDETEYASSWCIGLAESIIDEERELRASAEVDRTSYQYVRKRLWERFENLERGLMSNGIARPEGRR